MSEAAKPKRPQFRNIHITQLAGYRLPLAGVVSFMHRVSGFFLFLMLPLLLCLLDQSLLSEDTYAALHGFASHWFVKLVILALSWAYLHHFCAGIRHILMDNHIGVDKIAARKTAVTVLVISITLAALVALKLFGAF
jgi:succinate dehydrogenase / fumarate reductase cytochrome b subunit